MLHPILLQVVTEDPNIASPETQEVGLSLWDLALKGGWIMIPLALLWLMGLYLFFERYLALRAASKIDRAFMDRIQEYVSEGKFDAAMNLCQVQQTPVSRMIAKGVERIGRPLADIGTSVENAGNLEVAKLERGLPMLATISGGAPMIGFLGTVIGMIQAFYDMSMAGNNIDVSLLAGGIYTAMVTTVGGLIVGVMAYFGYNYLVARVSSVVLQMEANTLEFMDMVDCNDHTPTA